MDVAAIRPFIDWTPFFNTWEMKGVYPQILNDPTKGPHARELYDNANAMLDRIVAQDWFSPRGVAAIWPANSDGDDILVWEDESRETLRARMPQLRQQGQKSGGKPHMCLSDFVAPKAHRTGSAALP